MLLEQAKLGMMCATSKGDGVVCGIDAAQQQLTIKSFVDQHEFTVGIDDVLDDPQIHNSEDIYY